MTRSYEILFDLETVRDYAKAAARKVTSASVEHPDAIERNLSFIRNTLSDVQDQIAIIEAKLPQPKEVKRVA